MEPPSLNQLLLGQLGQFYSRTKCNKLAVYTSQIPIRQFPGNEVTRAKGSNTFNYPRKTFNVFSSNINLTIMLPPYSMQDGKCLFEIMVCVNNLENLIVLVTVF